MKNLLLILMMLAGSYANAGDGTLPVIRSVQVDFIQIGQDLQGVLPECINIRMNKSVKHSVKKVVTLRQADLEQTLQFQNKGGDLAVNVASRSISDQVLIHMNRQDLNQNEFLNEFNHKENILIQHVQINPQGIDKNCTKM